MKPGNVGHWIMLLEYLESPAFKQNRPQVLVWQMFEPTYAQGPDAKGLGQRLHHDRRRLARPHEGGGGAIAPWRNPTRRRRPRRAIGATRS